MTLDELGLQHGTDKASSFHDYLTFYESFLASRRSDPIRLLEMGVSTGVSLRMWRDYFPRAQIVGMDIDADCRQHADGRIEIIVGDQRDPECLQTYGAGFDVIIDDACHHPAAQIFAYATLVPMLNPGGIYILEDLEFADIAHFMTDIARKVIGVPPVASDRHRPDLYRKSGPQKLLWDRIKSISFKHLTSVTVTV